MANKKDDKKVTDTATPTPTPAPADKTVPQPPAEPSFNPLSEAVNEKSYSGGAATTNPNDDIAAPSYKPPTEESVNAPGKIYTKQEEKEKKQQDSKTANPDMQGMNDKEKEAGAAAMTDVILTTWEQLYAGANQLFKISEKTVNKMQQAGQIDVRVEVPYKMSVHPLSTVLRDYNNDADNLLVLEPEFKEEIHPLITEELAKAGHGMSSRQKLIYLISTKLMADGFKAYQFLSLKKDYLKFAREATAGFTKRPTTAPPVEPTHEETASNNSEQEFVQMEINEEKLREQEQEHTQAPMTLQEEALNRLAPHGGVNNTANFGNGRKLARLNKEYKKEEKVSKQTAKSTAKKHINAAKSGQVSNDPAPTAKRIGKKGRPPGAKNKPKKK